MFTAPLLRTNFLTQLTRILLFHYNRLLRKINQRASEFFRLYFTLIKSAALMWIERSNHLVCFELPDAHSTLWKPFHSVCMYACPFYTLCDFLLYSEFTWRVQQPQIASAVFPASKCLSLEQKHRTFSCTDDTLLHQYFITYCQQLLSVSWSLGYLGLQPIWTSVCAVQWNTHTIVNEG